jgi:hypothetical protein
MTLTEMTNDLQENSNFMATEFMETNKFNNSIYTQNGGVTMHSVKRLVAV